ncbi:hypothetical protein [Teredinibacter haidensis]|uniref:hypothetical protein n=1 Tax=Teredinibacter haidensis TaxID=2731755 RepID=UPI0011153094|nr:hypothetical protein [Teredinibacter haidensis]
MNIDEKLAKEYFVLQGYGSLVFEPDGNCPPDFSISSRVGIEVRRLNKNHTKNGKRVGLEQESTPIVDCINSSLKSFGKVKGLSCYLGIISLKRPFPTIKKVKLAVKENVESFLKNPTSSVYTFDIGGSLIVKLAEASDDHEFTFEVGAITDFDLGGWVVPGVLENIRLCIAEKTEKIQPYLNNYSEWWLLLVDHIGYGRNGVEISNSTIRPKEWNKIIVIDPVSKSAYEI